ncbi:hypothetical protein Avbf_13331 [Armadillidium vulgare]|nr:hypothetical protein Avbf_13331 [Armadillidium vulgare]
MTNFSIEFMKYFEQERNYLANINIKGEIDVKDEPFDIIEAKDESLGIEEENSMIDELFEPSSAVDENQFITIFLLKNKY